MTARAHPKMVKVIKNIKMPERYTVNGTLIPQDPQGNDMCVLFLKYGRCRFKQKCKKSHWVPPLPEEPYPFEIKPPLPEDETTDSRRTKKITSIASSQNSLPFENECEKLQKIQTYELDLDSSAYDKEFHLSAVQTETLMDNCLQDNIMAIDLYSRKTNAKGEVNSRPKTIMVARRFKEIFHDSYVGAVEYSGVEKMFHDAEVYYNNLTQKVEMVNEPNNKIEKHHLKILRRLHWKYMQRLKEKLALYPSSFSLNFDRNKIDFTRLRPYLYLLIHECLCSNSIKKTVKPSPLDYLVADTLIVYIEKKSVTAQEAEEKLQNWGARPVRARQCIDHLWHILAVSSKSPQGCAPEICNIEREVTTGARDVITKVKDPSPTNSRTGAVYKIPCAECNASYVGETGRTLECRIKEHKRSMFITCQPNTKSALDYACACSFALVRTKVQATMTNDTFTPRKVTATVKQGRQAAKSNLLRKKNEQMNSLKQFPLATCNLDSENTGGQMENKKKKSCDVLSSKLQKKRRRSRQFKKVSSSERKRIKSRCINFLSELTC